MPIAVRRTWTPPLHRLTGVIAALPLLFFLVFHHRAVRAMPSVRDWVNSHSWLVNIIACLIFVVLILTKLGSAL